MEIRFLTLEEVLHIHEQSLEAYGGVSGVRDQNALQSAVFSPAQTFDGNFLYESLAAMASAYWFDISENQAFVDGNKRTAIIACEAFLNYNGLELTLDDDSEAYKIAMQIANRELRREDLEQLIDENTGPLSE